MGNLQDPIAAERQVAQFQARIDDLETQYLEALEKQEALELEEGIQQDNILNHQKQTLRITDALETIRPPTLDRLAVLEAESEALLEQMNPSVSNLYRLMNAKKERAVAGVHQRCLWSVFYETADRAFVDCAASLYHLSLSLLQRLFDSRRWIENSFSGR